MGTFIKALRPRGRMNVCVPCDIHLSPFGLTKCTYWYIANTNSTGIITSKTPCRVAPGEQVFGEVMKLPTKCLGS